MRVALVVVSCALAVALLGDDVGANKLLDTSKRCAGEAQLGSVPVKELLRHGGEPSKQVKCFMACMAREYDLMSHGKFDKDKLFSLLPSDMQNRDHAVEIVAKCSDMTGSDDCETVYLAVKCLRDDQISLPFLPEQQ